MPSNTETPNTTADINRAPAISRIESISHDPIDARIFELPAKVRELQNKRP